MPQVEGGTRLQVDHIVGDKQGAGARECIPYGATIAHDTQIRE